MRAGISHLAASAGAKCILLFGPADPDVWAPMNRNVTFCTSRAGRSTILDERDALPVVWKDDRRSIVRATFRTLKGLVELWVRELM
jgi:ADP-heptose:LPS heptosyltransferase